MDIGTAKPTPEERAALPHQLIDIVYPDEPFGLATWLDLANEALESALGRAGACRCWSAAPGSTSGRCSKAGASPRSRAHDELRRELEQRPPEDLLAELHRIDPESQEYIQPQNVRRVIRALEVYHATGKPFSHWRTKEPPAFDWLAIGVTPLARGAVRAHRLARGRDVRGRLRRRGPPPARDGLRARPAARCPASATARSARHLDGEMTLAEAIKRTKTGTHRLARHQNAWFKQTDERIHWIAPGDADAAMSAASEFLEARGMIERTADHRRHRRAGRRQVHRRPPARRALRTGAFVEADALQRMIVSGGALGHRRPATPRRTARQRLPRQLRLRLHNACLLARSFYEAGFTAVVDDIIIGERFEHLREDLAGVPFHLVVLAPNVAVVEARDAARDYTVGGGWAEYLDREQRATMSGIGLWLDTSHQTPEETVDEIMRRVWDEGLVKS